MGLFYARFYFKNNHVGMKVTELLTNKEGD
jgi:hypothetical protein